MATKSRDADAKEKAATPVLRGAATADRGSATIGSSKRGFNRGAWTAVEDRKLAEAIEIYGPKRWKSIAVQAGLNRCGKSCRLRWLNYLRPNIKRGNISDQEEDLILRLHKLLGNRWALIAGRIPGRTDNEIKNYWNSHLSKKLKENQKQVRAPTRPRPHPPTNHHRRRNMSTGAKSENAATTTTTTRAAQGAVGMDEARCCYRGEVEGEEEAEDDDDDSNSNGTTSASGATTDHEDRHPSPKDAIFDVDDFFDFSNENPSSLEWVNNFIELDPSQFMPICINK